MTYTTGVCPYCGQLANIGSEVETQEEATELAIEVCTCAGARHERETVDKIEAAFDRIDDLFGEDATRYGFQPLTKPEPIEVLKQIAVLVARGSLSSAGLSVTGQCRAKIGLTSKGEIKVERSEARSCQLST